MSRTDRWNSGHHPFMGDDRLLMGMLSRLGEAEAERDDAEAENPLGKQGLPVSQSVFPPGNIQTGAGQQAQTQYADQIGNIVPNNIAK